MSLLEVEGLVTHFIARDLDNQIRVAEALNGVSFSLEAGRILGLVGETGAGKSLTALSVLGLLRPPARLIAGRVLFEGRDLAALKPEELNALRGDRIGLVVQSPKSSLDPLSRIGEQLVRVQRVHRKLSHAEALARAQRMLEAVGIPDPARRLLSYPHEFSGGMAQRVLIALALINEPRLLIADEPTTGLDVTVQAQILDLIRALVREKGIGAIIITHDLGVVAHYCDEVAVMFAGGIIEAGDVRQVLGRPLHPYTQALIASTPDRLRIGQTRVPSAPPPNLYALPPGCHYAYRCPRAAPVCETPPAARPLADGRRIRCHLAGEAGT
jgi:oligopeptide/dipeptide ABC transporter ATP-binding protein